MCLCPATSFEPKHRHEILVTNMSLRLSSERSNRVHEAKITPSPREMKSPQSTENRTNTEVSQQVGSNSSLSLRTPLKNELRSEIAGCEKLRVSEVRGRLFGQPLALVGKAFSPPKADCGAVPSPRPQAVPVQGVGRSLGGCKGELKRRGFPAQSENTENARG